MRQAEQWPLKNVYILMPGSSENNTSCGKMDFADLMKLRVPRVLIR